MTDGNYVSRRRYEREKAARKSAEELLELKARELYETNQDLVQLADSLEEKVQERTQELESLKDIALEANQAKSAFLANMSHEVRTPLTAVIGFAENIQNGRLNAAEQADAVDRIVNNGRHLLAILDEVLEISMIESEKADIVKSRFSLYNMLCELNTIYSMGAAAKGLEFSLHGLNDIPKDIVSDSLRVRKVLNSLLENAVKFTPKGSIDVRVGFNKGKKTFSFVVTDTGIGIARKKQHGLFKIFTQVDQAANRKYGGLGLGLAISQNFAALLGGSIQFKSEKSKGAAFTFHFPVDEYFIESEFSYDNRHYPEQVPLIGNVLIVEDNEVNQALIKQDLSILDVTVDTAENGEQAVEKALSNDFDLILMDIQMPVMDGKEAHQMLRKVGYSQPIIAVTANVMRHDIIEYRDLGFDDVLGKPIDKQKFYATLNKYLRPSGNSKKMLPAISESIMEELRQKFLKSLYGYHEQISIAQNDGNRELLEDQLHQLKGICGSFEYDVLTGLADEAYKRLRQHDLTVNEMLPELLSELHKLSALEDDKVNE